MSMLLFARRNGQEILREPVNLAFGLGFPLGLLCMLLAIGSGAPVELFTVGKLTPGMIVFGFSFLALFSGQLIAHDRASAFLVRLYTTPMVSRDFVLGYCLPLLPMALGQCLMVLAGAVAWGLPVSGRLGLLILVSLPAAVFYIALGLLCGSLLSERSVGGICGALVTNATALLSGAWFDLALVGKGFAQAARLLPFARAVDAGRAVLTGETPWPDLLWVIGWAMVTLGLAILAYHRKMKR